MPEASKQTVKATARLMWPTEYEGPGLYANQFLVAATESEVTLVFGEFLPVGFVGASPDEFEGEPPPATITPVAKIVLTPRGFDAFTKMIVRHLQEDSDEPSE